jgi:hypothetical protein
MKHILPVITVIIVTLGVSGCNPDQTNNNISQLSESAIEFGLMHSGSTQLPLNEAAINLGLKEY